MKILTPNKLLARLSVLLAQTKLINNSYKLKDEIRHNKITKKHYSNLIRSL